MHDRVRAITAACSTLGERVQRVAPAPHALLLIAVTGCLAFAAAEPLTQSDGDLLAHIAVGRILLADPTGVHIPSLGFAPTPSPAVAPAWGAAVIFAWLDAHGGLAMCAVFTAVLAGITHGVLALWWRARDMSEPLLMAAISVSVALASSHWLARPHAFSLLGSALLLVMLTRWRWWCAFAVPLLFVVWANLHGGWLFGWLVLAAYSFGMCVTWWRSAERRARTIYRRRAIILAVVTGLSALVSLLTPFGIALHLAILRTLLSGGVAQAIDEYAPPGFSHGGDVLFFVTLLVGAVMVLRRSRRLPLSWAMVMLLSAVFALKAGRNIALFAVTGWPLMVAQAAPRGRARTCPSRAHTAAPPSVAPGVFWAMLLGAVLVNIGVNGGYLFGASLVQGDINPRRFPIEAVAWLQAHRAGERLLTTWTWSGYVPYAWPGQRSYFDPLSFTDYTMRSLGTMLLASNGWSRQLDANRIALVLVPRGEPLADSLRPLVGWVTLHEDRTAFVFGRVGK